MKNKPLKPSLYPGEVVTGAKAVAAAKDALHKAARNRSNDREVIAELARAIENAERRLRKRSKT